VGLTPEQRSQHALCGAKRKNGKPCRLFAGQKTEHRGVGRCFLHGGATTSHKKHAVAVEAKQRMVKLGQPIQGIKPHQALLGMLQATTGHVSWLYEEIGALEDLSTPEAQVIVKLYDDERDRAARIAESCLRAGVEEGELRFARRISELLAHVIRAGIDGVGGLTAEQRHKFFEVCMLELQMKSTDAPEDGQRPAGPFPSTPAA
jgi:hypothetical protein